LEPVEGHRIDEGGVMSRDAHLAGLLGPHRLGGQVIAHLAGEVGRACPIRREFSATQFGDPAWSLSDQSATGTTSITAVTSASEMVGVT
jgi:hypothetical protein